MTLVNVLGIASRNHRARPRMKRLGSALTLTRQDEMGIFNIEKRTCQVTNDFSIQTSDDDAEKGSQEEKGRVSEEDGQVLAKDDTEQDSPDLTEKRTIDIWFSCRDHCKVTSHVRPELKKQKNKHHYDDSVIYPTV